jgi:HSP20 family protein
MTTTTTSNPVPVRKNEEHERELVPTGSMLANLRHEMDELWGRPLQELWERPFQMLFEPFSRNLRGTGKTMTVWTPTIDAYEKEGELIVRADLPGLTKENVKVTIEEGELVLRGERKFEKETKEKDFYRNECSYGSFYRRLALPFEADPKLIAASYKDGVLEVKVPIPAVSRPETHTISVS